MRLNGQTIGNATSGATGRANADTQNLFVYLWGLCNQAHCPVTGSIRGSTALGDFTASKTIQLPDWRARMPVGLDDMGNIAAGILQAKNVTSSGDGVTTPFATGGEAVHTQIIAEMAAHNHSISDPGHSHSGGGSLVQITTSGSPQNVGFAPASTASATTGVSINNTGSSIPFSVMNPFMLGTWHMKL